MDGKSEKRFIGLLKEKMADPPRISSQVSYAPEVDLPGLESESISEKQSIAIKLKELESEHQSSIERSFRKIQDVKEKRDKLKTALDILIELSLYIPEEYGQQLDSYPSEIEKLGTEIEQERMKLNYLRTKVIPLIDSP